MKGAEMYMQIKWIIFLKKFLFGTNGPFTNQKWWLYENFICCPPSRKIGDKFWDDGGGC